MKIRRAQASDAPALARVHVDSWQAAYRGLVPDSLLEAFSYQNRLGYFQQALAASAEGETYVVQEGDEVVGFLTLGTSRDTDLDPECTGEIWGIYLSPTHQRQGIGTRVLEEAERVLKLRGYRDAVLWVLDGNERARQFYDAMGFSPDGKSKTIELGTVLKATRYRKALR